MHAVPPPLPRTAPTRLAAGPPGSGWAWCGAGAGLAGLIGLFGTAGIYTQDAWDAGDNDRMAASVAEHATLVWAHQALCALVVTLLVVFAAGLYRHLALREPPGGLVPAVAAAGVLLTAVAVFLGAGLDTELWWSVGTGAIADPDTVGSMVVHYGALPWLWGGLGLSAAAVARAGFARRSAGRGLALTSAVAAVLLLATQVTPVQYIALLPGALWLIVAGPLLARQRTVLAGARAAAD
ncbi:MULTISPECIES: hypothetical protein [Pseudonocardia]|uniref:DUF998 domain-containing protein n=2 Tax=Pseudonocardia TaxID=1847 RepID=A0A1Y2N1Z8_PSEAH|nr:MULTISPECIES: hypothetical protein [Pseudonocardia]OSY41494.1 hypothetical protein BG845_01985 [Pseudonocardia autotrophica]TDN71450.1 hypothetical protein C8E95_0481 [Pseudonocardia autotrophica]BBG02125.1 hypothetical protein Pdca_33340 [Pseudonocardia autotrophica]GEC24139.1 hypothetical protein PSA01_11680 [Pseudonocardia saturnea]